MLKNIYVITQKVRDIIFPLVCVICQVILEHDTTICTDCAQTIIPVATIDLTITNMHTVPVHAISGYTDPLQRLVRAKNYRDIHASWQLGNLIWQMTDIKHIPVDYWVPIPLHWSRSMSRGFNQAHEMAHILHKKSGKPVYDLLKRVRRTSFQARLDKKDRAQNVAGVFALRNHSSLKDKHIVIVDDLLTTGATVKQAVKEIKILRPASIRVVVACRVT